MNRIVIVGAGGFGRETLDIFEEINTKEKKWDIHGFVDDDPKISGTLIRGYPVLGNVNWLIENVENDLKAVIAIGDNKARKIVVEKLKNAGMSFCTIIHPSVIITPHVTIGEGGIICAGSILTNNIKLGEHVIVNLDCTIGHDTIIENFVNLSPGIHVSGNNTFREGVFVGTGAVTIQGVTIGEWSVVGAGAVVIKDITPRVVAVGIPAKEVKKIEN